MLDEFIDNKKILTEKVHSNYTILMASPFELTKEIAEEQGLKVDETGFKAAMQEQKRPCKSCNS